MHRWLTSLSFPRISFPFIAWTFFSAVCPASATNWTVRARPKLVNGGPVLFQVKPPQKLESLNGTWLGHELTFSFDTTSKTWFALAGVSLDTGPGTYALELAGETKAGKSSSTKLSFSHKFVVTRAKYPKIEVKLSVEGKFTEPTPEQQKQIQDAQEIKKEYLNRVTP